MPSPKSHIGRDKNWFVTFIDKMFKKTPPIKDWRMEEPNHSTSLLPEKCSHIEMYRTDVDVDKLVDMKHRILKKNRGLKSQLVIVQDIPEIRKSGFSEDEQKKLVISQLKDRIQRLKRSSKEARTVF